MKSFKSYIKEASGFPTGPVGENPNNVGGSLDVNPTDVGDPSMLKRLNAIVLVVDLVKTRILHMMSF